MPAVAAVNVKYMFGALFGRMEIIESCGVVFRAKEQLYVDAFGIRGKHALVTHAHSDHAKVSRSNTYYLTPQTSALIGSKEKGLNVQEVPFGKKFCVGGFECCFHPSGHILGAGQLQVSNGAEAVLTSDFKLQKSILFEGAEVLPSGILVIESTFGKPEFVFPPREQVYEEIIKWVSHNLSKNNFVVLGGYSTGKAQELTKIVNEFLGETPLVHKRVFEQNNVYEQEGVKLGNYICLDHNLNDARVLIMPPHLINNNLLLALQHQLGKSVEAAIATGWRNYYGYKSFPLSDHADFNGLMTYVKESSPKLVLTTHGFEEDFARTVQRKLGIPARPLSRAGQKTIMEFSG